MKTYQAGTVRGILTLVYKDSQYKFHRYSGTTYAYRETLSNALQRLNEGTSKNKNVLKD